MLNYNIFTTFSKTISQLYVIPNKTYIGFINEEIFNDNEELIFHYLRGYSDGDGFINKNKGKLCIQINIKSKSILNTITNWIKNIVMLIQKLWKAHID